MDIARNHRVMLLAVSMALALFSIFASRAAASVALSGVVPVDYNYRVAWSPGSRVLSGSGSINVENRSATPVSTVWLRLRPNYPDRIETISNLRAAAVSGRAAGGSMVRLRLDSPLAAGKTRRFYFNLRLRVPTDDTSLGRSAGVDLFGDALPVVAVAGPRGVRIGPEPSYGEGSFNPVASWRLRVKVPRRLQVVLPGAQMPTGVTRHSALFESMARVRDAAFAIGRFSARSERIRGRLITVVAARELRGELPAALRRAVNAFRKMQGWYGGYRLPGLTVVLGDLSFGGSEYPGLVFSTPDNATIAHEVAHQWFYGLVGNDQYNDPFLDESLTAFSEQRFHKSYRCNLASPIDGRSHGLGTGMAYWQKHPGEYEHTIYRGGACALTVLQHDLGRAVFDQALRAYVSANSDQIAGVEDFLAAIRAVAPNYDLARWEKLVGL